MSKNNISTEKKNNNKNLFKIDSKKNNCNSPQMSSKKSNYPTIKDINKYWDNELEGQEKSVSFTKNFKKIKLEHDHRYSYTLFMSKTEYIENILNKENLLSIRYLREVIADNWNFGENYYYGNRSRTNKYYNRDKWD